MKNYKYPLVRYDSREELSLQIKALLVAFEAEKDLRKQMILITTAKKLNYQICVFYGSQNSNSAKMDGTTGPLETGGLGDLNRYLPDTIDEQQ